MKRKCFRRQSIVGKLCMLCLLALCVTNVSAEGKKLNNGAMRYEAEDAQIVNSTHKKPDAPVGCEKQPFFSGKYAAGGLNKNTSLNDVAEDWSNIAYVVFKVNAKEAGRHKMILRYNGDDDKTILIMVNSGNREVVPIPRCAGGRWNKMLEYVTEVNLKKGLNEIKISGTIAGAGWLNIDYIDLSPVVE